MNIGIEVQRLFRPKKHGMEVVALELIRQIQNLDTQNSYTVYAKNDQDRDCLSESTNLKINTLNSKTYMDWEQFSLPKAVKRDKIDFLHCTCNTAPLKSPVPFMVTIHDIIYLENIEFKGTAYQNFGNLYRRFLVPRIAEKSRFIVTVSNFEKAFMLERLNIPEEKIKVVYNAVNERFNTHYSEADKQAFRQRFNLPTDYILFLGYAAPRKNALGVIQAYAQYCSRVKDNLPMVILGNDKAYVEDALEKIGKGECIDRFLFPGYIPTPDMPLLYSTCSLFLYPSLREGFGLPILEAMACGAPVITSNTSSMPEVAGDSAYLVDPYKLEEITEGIIHLSQNESQRQNLISKGLDRAKLFTWKSTAEKILDLYSLMK